MKTSELIGASIAAVFIGIAGIFFEAWLLGVILSWFAVSLTFWQNVCIIVLANLIFNRSSSK